MRAIIVLVVVLAGCSAEAGIERQVAAALKDPGSAEFGETSIRRGVACGSVNAKNGFGGYTGATPFMVRDGALYVGPEVGTCCKLHQLQKLGEGAARMLAQCHLKLPEPVPLG